jgi:hypothetical protein
VSANQFQKVRTSGAKKAASEAAPKVMLTEPAPAANTATTVADIPAVTAEDIKAVKARANVPVETPAAPPPPQHRLMGPPGKDGNTILGFPADPEPIYGLNGDFWINTASFDFFERRDGAWNRLGNLRGNAGPPGPQGAQGLRGLPGPASLTASTLATEITGRAYPDNAAARADGLPPGSLYHTDGVLKIVL